MVRKTIDLSPQDAYDRFPELREDGIDMSEIESSTHSFTIMSRELQSLTEGGEHATATIMKHIGQPATKSRILDVADDLGISGNGADQYSPATISKCVGKLYSHKLADRVETNGGREQYAYKLTPACHQELKDLGDYVVKQTDMEKNQKHMVLEAIKAGSRVSISDIVSATPLDRRQIHQALSELRKATAIKRTGDRYVLTSGNGKLLLKTWRQRFEDGYQTLPDGMWSAVINSADAYKEYQ